MISPFFAFSNEKAAERRNRNHKYVIGFTRVLPFIVPGFGLTRSMDIFTISLCVVIWIEARFYRVGGAAFYRRFTSVLALSCVATVLISATVTASGVFAAGLRNLEWIAALVPRARAEVVMFEQYGWITTAILRRELFVVTILMTTLTLAVLALHWRSYRRQCFEIIAARGGLEESFFTIYASNVFFAAIMIALALFEGNRGVPPNISVSPDFPPVGLFVGIVVGTSMIASAIALRMVVRAAHKKRQNRKQLNVALG